MKSTRRPARSAWGVQISDAGVQLIRLTHESDACRVTEHQWIAHSERWKREPDWPALLAQVHAKVGDEPVGVAIADEWVLYRRLSLPATSPQQLQKMIEAQVQVVLPDAGLLGWGWMSLGEMAAGDARQQQVLIGAVGRPLLEQIVTGLSERRLCAASPTAIAQAAPLLGRQTADDVMLVNIEAWHSSLTVLSGGRIVAVGVVAEGYGPWVELLAEHGNMPLNEAEARLWALLGERADEERDEQVESFEPAVQQWMRQLTRAAQRVVAETPGSKPPGRAMVVGCAGSSPTVQSWVAKVTGLRTGAVELGGEVTVPEDLDATSALAGIGAAWQASEAVDETINFVKPAAQARRLARMPLTVAAGVVWLLVVLGIMYQLDRSEAERLHDAVAEARLIVDRQQADHAHSAVTRHLEQGALPPLMVLAELAVIAPESVLLDSWQYAREGEVRIGGKIGSADDLQKLLNDIVASPVFDRVEMRDMSIDGRDRKFELTAWTSAVARYDMLVEAQDDEQTPSAASANDDEQGADS